MQLIYNYRDSGTLAVTIVGILVYFNFWMLTFIEIIDSLRQSALSVNINPPVGKLLVLINQLVCGWC